MVARANGSVKPLQQVAAELPHDAVLPGLQAPNLPDTEVIGSVLAELAAEAEAPRERSGVVSVLIPDAAVRVALVPLEGAEPNRAEGAAMARWALSDLLPVEAGEARIDWSVMAPASAEPGPTWLLAIGADAAVVREYESVVESVGWIPGRVAPLTMALAVGADDTMIDEDPRSARLVLSGVGGQVACLVEAGGVPRFHRAWRGADPDLAFELPSLQRYIETRLDLVVVDTVVAGPEAWRVRAATQCAALGWKVRERSGWSAHIGALQP